MPFARPNTKHSSSTGLVNTLRNPVNTIPETPNLTQKDINSKESVRRIIESEKLSDKICEKLKTESLKTEITSLESTISFSLQKELKHIERFV